MQQVGYGRGVRQEEVTSEYLRSVPGRLLLLALLIPMAAGALLPAKAEVVGIYALPILGATALSVIAIGLGLDKHPGIAALEMLVLPVALFFYVLLVGSVIPHVHAIVYVMGACALVLLAMAARPSLPAAPAYITLRPAAYHS